MENPDINKSDLSTKGGRDEHKHEKRMFNSMFTFNFQSALKEGKRKKLINTFVYTSEVKKPQKSEEKKPRQRSYGVSRKKRWYNNHKRVFRKKRWNNHNDNRRKETINTLAKHYEQDQNNEMIGKDIVCTGDSTMIEPCIPGKFSKLCF